MFYENWDYVIIPDCRFSNEVDRLREANFDVVTLRVVRDGFTSQLTAEQLAHSSETAMDNYEFDYVVHNGQMLEFYQNLNKVLEEITATIPKEE